MNAVRPAIRIAIAQIDCTVGDLTGNARIILDACRRAQAAGADLLVTPELALSGYPPEDLLLRPDFHRACRRELDALAAAVPLPLLVGHPEFSAGRCYNAASLLAGGAVVATYRKRQLPNYAVFDEERYFDAGEAACVIDIRGTRLGVNICEDIWAAPAAAAARVAGAELLLVLNASPFHMNKQQDRYGVLRQRALETAMPMIYVNMVGGQDELVFDGASFAIAADGSVVHQSPAFVDDLAMIEVANGAIVAGRIAPTAAIEAEVYEALKLGVRDYLGKNGFPGAIIGLSGGIDSALTLCIAVDALGAERVRAVMMPSPYTAQMSLDDSRALVERLGVRYDEIAIEPAMNTYAALLEPLFAGLPPTTWADTTPENIQARIRGMVLMALSNRTGSIVLTTGNKSEMAVGYATLYGDMAGGFAVIKDVLKTFVYRLARYRNDISADGHPVIPENIITRAPSAELRPDQTDQDSLPPYETLDAIIDAYMTQESSPREIVAQGHSAADVRRVVGMLQRNEYKRRQSPVGIRISRRAFGRDWRYPITSRYADEW